MLFWIFAILLVLCLAFGIFIRVCVTIDNKRDRKCWDIKDYDERQAYRKKYKSGLAHKVDCNIASEWPEHATWAASAILGITVLVMSIFIMEAHIPAEATAEQYQKRYESLLYQYENDVYDSDDDVVGKRDLYTDIESWNSDLAYRKRIQRDFWVGIFHPNIYDQFEFIEYK